MLIILRDFVLFVIEVLVGFGWFKPERGEGGKVAYFHSLVVDEGVD